MDQMTQRIEIQCGDAIEKLKKMSSGSIDLIVADPPYNLNKDYGNGSDSKKFDEYLEFTRDWTQEGVYDNFPIG